jgi:hypothetical protein
MRSKRGRVTQNRDTELGRKLDKLQRDIAAHRKQLYESRRKAETIRQEVEIEREIRALDSSLKPPAAAE